MIYLPYKLVTFERFSRLISTHCTESIVDLDFIEKFRLDRLCTPFKNMKSVFYKPSVSYALSYGRIVWSNEQNVSDITTFGLPPLGQKINCHLPHLEYVYLYETRDHYERSPLKSLFAKNSRIQSARLERTTQ